MEAKVTQIQTLLQQKGLGVQLPSCWEDLVSFHHFNSSTFLLALKLQFSDLWWGNKSSPEPHKSLLFGSFQTTSRRPNDRERRKTNPWPAGLSRPPPPLPCPHLNAPGRYHVYQNTLEFHSTYNILAVKNTTSLVLRVTLLFIFRCRCSFFPSFGADGFLPWLHPRLLWNLKGLEKFQHLPVCVANGDGRQVGLLRGTIVGGLNLFLLGKTLLSCH